MKSWEHLLNCFALGLALENNMERVVIKEWRQLQIFVNVLLEGRTNKSRSEAIKVLKLVFD